MKIKLQQIGDKPSSYAFDLNRSNLTKLEERFKFDSILCKAELTPKQDAIMLHGAYAVSIETSCDICLEPVCFHMEQEFDLVVVNEEAYTAPEGDAEISVRSEDVDFYSGQEISLSGYFEDQLLLDLPFSFKCSEDCRGICPECGINRNFDSCRCADKTGNNPFSVLGDLEN